MSSANRPYQLEMLSRNDIGVVRYLMHNNEIWFVAVDVALAVNPKSNIGCVRDICNLKDNEYIKISCCSYGQGQRERGMVNKNGARKIIKKFGLKDSDLNAKVENWLCDETDLRKYNVDPWENQQIKEPPTLTTINRLGFGDARVAIYNDSLWYVVSDILHVIGAKQNPTYVINYCGIADSHSKKVTCIDGGNRVARILADKAGIHEIIETFATKRKEVVDEIKKWLCEDLELNREMDKELIKNKGDYAVPSKLNGEDNNYYRGLIDGLQLMNNPKSVDAAKKAKFAGAVVWRMNDLFSKGDNESMERLADSMERLFGGVE